jgi:hypothetical protein
LCHGAIFQALRHVIEGQPWSPVNHGGPPSIEALIGSTADIWPTPARRKWAGAMKALLLLVLLWGMTGCVTVSPRSLEASDASSPSEALGLGRNWRESDDREKPRRSHRKEHLSGRGTHTSACKPGAVKGRSRGASSKGTGGRASGRR